VFLAQLTKAKQHDTPDYYAEQDDETSRLGGADRRAIPQKHPISSMEGR